VTARRRVRIKSCSTEGPGASRLPCSASAGSPRAPHDRTRSAPRRPDGRVRWRRRRRTSLSVLNRPDRPDAPPRDRADGDDWAVPRTRSWMAVQDRASRRKASSPARRNDYAGHRAAMRTLVTMTRLEVGDDLAPKAATSMRSADRYAVRPNGTSRRRTMLQSGRRDRVPASTTPASRPDLRCIAHAIDRLRSRRAGQLRRGHGRPLLRPFRATRPKSCPLRSELARSHSALRRAPRLVLAPRRATSDRGGAPGLGYRRPGLETKLVGESAWPRAFRRHHGVGWLPGIRIRSTTSGCCRKPAEDEQGGFSMKSTG
jgi:hypothetical protein